MLRASNMSMIDHREVHHASVANRLQQSRQRFHEQRRIQFQNRAINLSQRLSDAYVSPIAQRRIQRRSMEIESTSRHISNFLNIQRDSGLYSGPRNRGINNVNALTQFGQSIGITAQS